MTRWLLVTVAAILFPLLASRQSIAQNWQPGGKEVNWLDPNFVPCDGMGATASGNIQVRVGYLKDGDVVKVTDWQLRTRYSHDHSPTARLTWEKPAGGQNSMNLEPAWFSTISPNDGSRYLFLARNGNQAGAKGQTPFEMKAGTVVQISIVTLFPQHGGNCVASFSDELTLP